MFRYYKAVDQKYKNKNRNIVANLRDSLNQVSLAKVLVKTYKKTKLIQYDFYLIFNFCRAYSGKFCTDVSSHITW